jgi:hypothetical protein
MKLRCDLNAANAKRMRFSSMRPNARANLQPDHNDAPASEASGRTPNCLFCTQ